MNAGALRAGAAVFVIGLLVVWLIRPIGNPCPDVDKLPTGATGSSAPSFAPPMTRTCTYTTLDGTKARKRHVPLLDVLVLLVVAGLAGTAVGLVGPGSGSPRPPRPPRPPRSTAEPEPELARERARQEREARRRN